VGAHIPAWGPGGVPGGVRGGRGRSRSVEVGRGRGRSRSVEVGRGRLVFLISEGGKEEGDSRRSPGERGWAECTTPEGDGTGKVGREGYRLGLL
jgi:hypothetical protein